MALGDYYYRRGELNQALKSYARTREYSASSTDAMLTMCMSYIRTSLENRSFPHAQSYITKAESAIREDKVTSAKLNAASGLCNLEQGSFKMASRKFLQVSAELGSQYSDVISQQDIGLYACVCALASFDRSELQRLVLSSGPFRHFLEQVPDMREILSDFYHSRYAAVLSGLDRLKPLLLLDMHLHQHVQRLYKSIREKALVQYFTPYSSVDMKAMAAAFNTTLAELESDVAALILESTIKARIDSQNQRLYVKSVDQRTNTFEQTLQIGDEFVTNTQLALLRINMFRSDFKVAPPRARGDDRGKASGKPGKEERKRKPE